jgi:hypothetical protein
MMIDELERIWKEVTVTNNGKLIQFALSSGIKPFLFAYPQM